MTGASINAYQLTAVSSVCGAPPTDVTPLTLKTCLSAAELGS